MSSENKIEAIFILEVLGKPPEHLIETLEELIKQIALEKGVNVKEKKVNDPHLIEKSDNLYTSFAEIVVECDEIMNLVVILFKYMPSHLQIIYPEKVTLKNSEMNDFTNEIIRRLHAYDEVARVIQFEKSVLETKLKDILGKKEENKEDED